MEKLAIKGGKPVRENYLPYGKQCIDEDDIKSVVEVLKSDYLTTGPVVAEFEQKVAEYVGVKYAVAVSNGTAALHVACLAAGIEEGDEVIVPAMTFAASSNCVLYCGAKPVFTDIDSSTLNIDTNCIERNINENTKAIIAVDFTGQSVDIDRIREIAKKHNLIIIEDGAHSLGSEYKGQKVGSKADMTTFSFHPVKPITTGEGGIVVTDDEELYKKLLLFRSHGITRDKNVIGESKGPWYYEQIELGYNYRITDIQCGLGISQMKKIDGFIERRRDIALKYNEAFKSIESISLQFEPEYSASGCHIYVVRLNMKILDASRKEIFEAIQAENIGVNVHYIPVYMHPYYTSIGYEKGICPEAERAYEEMLTLPLFPKMSDRDAADVVQAVKKVVEYYKKK